MSKEKFIEDNFFRPRWYSIFFSPYFIVRYSLFQNIKKFASSFEKEMNILDVGCGIKPYKSLFSAHKYYGIDIEGGHRTEETKKVDAYFDGVNIPYGDKSYDVVLCTEVLEHAEDYNKLIKECARVLKDDGALYLTLPLVWNEHEIPYDFRRFTRYEIKKMLGANGFKIKTIIPTTGTFGALGQLFCAAIFESITFRSPVFKLLLSIFVFAPVQIVSLVLEKLTGNKWITLGYITIATK